MVKDSKSHLVKEILYHAGMVTCESPRENKPPTGPPLLYVLVYEGPFMFTTAVKPYSGQLDLWLTFHQLEDVQVF